MNDLNVLAEKYANECKGGEYDYFYPEHFVKFCEENELKPVVHGHWIRIRQESNWDKGQCSNCKSNFSASFWGTKYCSRCGAKMDE